MTRLAALVFMMNLMYSAWLYVGEHWREVAVDVKIDPTDPCEAMDLQIKMTCAWLDANWRGLCK